VVLIVGGSAGMVQAALTLGHAWHISDSALGILALGPLTSLPNAMTGIRLGLANRGDALVAETLNSNTINLAAGAIAPSLFVTVTAATSAGKAELWWLVGMTALTALLVWRRAGLRRGGAIVVIVAYMGFVALALAHG
jgi:Ca2+/Na+ antiporter